MVKGKEAGVLCRVHRTHAPLKGGSHLSAPSNCHPEKTYPMLPDLSKFQEKPEIWIVI